MVSRYLRYTKRSAKSLACIVLILFLLHITHSVDLSFSRRYDTWPWTPCPSTSPFDPACTVPQGLVARDLLVVVRTGGSEPIERLRTQLETVLSVIPKENLVIFSDMAEEVDGHQVHDAYANISAQERANYPEFAMYDVQLDLQRQGKDTRAMEGGWVLGK
jgi:hypothetical protein